MIALADADSALTKAGDPWPVAGRDKASSRGEGNANPPAPGFKRGHTVEVVSGECQVAGLHRIAPVIWSNQKSTTDFIDRLTICVAVKCPKNSVR